MSFDEILAALRWWMILMLMGGTAVPLAYWFFQKLPDRGYAFSKMMGLLLVSYLFWLMASLGLVRNSVGSMLLAWLGVALLSGWAHGRTGGAWRPWLRDNWRYALTAEVGFALLFGLWVWVRANNPSITATEKPMEFAFLNSATYSPQYPPLDPWLSGFAISYYYFGYVMMAVLGKLAAVPTAIGFNLGMAWLVAGAGLGAFGLVYNLVVLFAGRAKRLAIALALMALVALPLAGNNQMLLEVLHGRGYFSESFWAWLHIQDIDGVARDVPRYLDGNGQASTLWWWWRASRPIREHHLSGRIEDGLTPIAEFPGFSFVLGDMHPHVLALPFVFLSLGVALSWYLHGRRDPDPPREPFWEMWQDVGWGRFLLTAVVIGGLAFLNTWDVLIHLFVLGGAYALARWWREGRMAGQIYVETAVLGAAMLVSAFLLYYPFYVGFNSQAGAPYILPMMMRPTRLAHFLVIFGLPLLVIVPFLISLVAQNHQRGRSAALTMFVGFPVGLMCVLILLAVMIASAPAGYGSVNGLANELGIVLPLPPDEGLQLGWGAGAVAAVLPTLLAARLRYGALTLFLAAILGGVVLVWHGRLGAESDRQVRGAREIGGEGMAVLPFVLLLLFTAVLLTIGPEFLYLRDNFGQRLNTIFKFYYQAWVLFGVTGLFALAYLWQRVRLVGGVMGVGYVVLLGVALLFPYRAVQSRTAEFRGSVTMENRREPTLDGLVFIENSRPDEYEAIRWLQENAAPTAVVLEATGNPYSYFGRVSANTGRPTVLGWANHEFQWRGDSTDEPAVRGAIVEELYETVDWGRTVALLNEYGVGYVFVGSVELNEHGGAGLDKFAENLPVAFANNGVTIYRWQPQE